MIQNLSHAAKATTIANFKEGAIFVQQQTLASKESQRVIFILLLETLTTIRVTTTLNDDQRNGKVEQSWHIIVTFHSRVKR